MTQSTMGMQQQDHSSIFIWILLNYILLDGAGFSLLNVAQGIEHYKTYSGYCLTIEKGTMGRYCLYGCRIHTKCQFCVSFGYEHGSVIITKKNPPNSFGDREINNYKGWQEEEETMQGET